LKKILIKILFVDQLYLSATRWVKNCQNLKMKKLNSFQKIPSEKITKNIKLSIVIIGTLESGKSSVFKHLNRNYNDFQFTEKECIEFRDSIYSNVLSATRTISIFLKIQQFHLTIQTILKEQQKLQNFVTKPQLTNDIIY
jgi:hypothetical protein